MANCPKCGAELTDDNKCACGYCMDDCQCGAEETNPAEETEQDSMEEGSADTESIE